MKSLQWSDFKRITKGKIINFTLDMTTLTNFFVEDWDCAAKPVPSRLRSIRVPRTQNFSWFKHTVYFKQRLWHIRNTLQGKSADNIIVTCIIHWQMLSGKNINFSLQLRTYQSVSVPDGAFGGWHQLRQFSVQFPENEAGWVLLQNRFPELTSLFTEVHPSENHSVTFRTC